MEVHPYLHPFGKDDLTAIFDIQRAFVTEPHILNLDQSAVADIDSTGPAGRNCTF